MVKSMSFYNTVFVFLTNLFCILEFCWRLEMLIHVNIFITTVKAIKKTLCVVCACVCVHFPFTKVILACLKKNFQKIDRGFLFLF